MYKLVILFLQTSATPAAFMQGWQAFLKLAERMPGLRKEIVSDVETLVFGPTHMQFRKIHELYFDSRDALESALESDAGQKAGQWLHSFTGGDFMLLTAKHMEATPAHFKKEEEIEAEV